MAGLLAAAAAWITVGHARAVIDCPATPAVFAQARDAVLGRLPEAERWTVMVIGSVAANGPAPNGYREVTLWVEASFKGPTSTSLTVFYPNINDEDVRDGSSFLEVGDRYFVTAGSYNRFAPGLATDACTATQRLSAIDARSLLEMDDGALILTPEAFLTEDSPSQLFVGLIALALLAAIVVLAVHVGLASKWVIRAQSRSHE